MYRPVYVDTVDRNVDIFLGLGPKLRYSVGLAKVVVVPAIIGCYNKRKNRAVLSKQRKRGTSHVRFKDQYQRNP
jgi:hypothetical protein